MDKTIFHDRRLTTWDINYSILISSLIESHNFIVCNYLIIYLNLGLLAMNYGLLKMPKMPELKASSVKDFVEHDIDINLVKYKDKEREQSRQKKLKIFSETGQWPGLKKKPLKAKESVPWSKCKDQKVKRKTFGKYTYSCFSYFKKYF